MSRNTNEFKGFLDSSPGWKARRVLDIRCEGDFRARHLAGACSFSLGSGHSADEIPSIVLPPRHVPLLVIGTASQRVEDVARSLQGRGRCEVESWVWTEESAGELPGDWLACGDSSSSLWEPPSWLSKHVGLLPPAAAGRVLDLGCGSGRAMVWLAKRGYRVEGMDWQPEALELGQQLADLEGVRCRFHPADLRDGGVVPAGPWSAILNFRYLQRDLFALMPRLLIPGGICLVRTFREAPGYQGHPHPRHRLGPAELLKNFPRGSFEILAHEEGFDEDGRPAAGVVARRLNP